MESDLKARRQVSLEQLQALVEFLREHPDLAKGLIRGRRGKLHTLKIWNQCAKKLNSYKDAVTKDGKGWSKYWCDWKYRVRRRALEIKASCDNGESTSEERTSLTNLEEAILTIIGETDMEGVVIKNDPLCEEPEDTEDHIQEEDIPFENTYETPEKPTRRLKRGSLKDTEDLHNNVDVYSGEQDTSKRLRRGGSLESDDENAIEQEFLRLEKENLEVSRRILAATEQLARNVGRIADALINNPTFSSLS